MGRVELSNDPLKQCEQLMRLQERGEMTPVMVAYRLGLLWERLTLKQRMAVNKWLIAQEDDGK